MTEPTDPFAGLPDLEDGWQREILPIIGDGSFDNPLRPSLPPGVDHYAIQGEIGGGAVVDFVPPGNEHPAGPPVEPEGHA